MNSLSKRRAWLACAALIAAAVVACSGTSPSRWHSGDVKVLVFSKTTGYRHDSIEAAGRALQRLGSEAGFAAQLSEDATVFNDAALTGYAAVVFLNTTGDILDEQQQGALRRYIQSGGGFVGIHSASDTEYDWPWYGELVGARFDSHPEIQQASLRIRNSGHPATTGLPDPWERRDEWYNLRDVQPGLNVLVEIDEASYSGGTNGAQHPMAWYREFDGGRSFYTALGHTRESYREPEFLAHLLGGLSWATRGAVIGAMPQDRFFQRDVLASNLNEPMELDELPGEGILFVERPGALKLYDFNTQQTRVLAELDVHYEHEDGLLGVAVDPGYRDNHWIYLFYSVPGAVPKQHISRFTLKNGQLLKASEQVLLEIPTDRSCCHSGGALEFGPDGLLYIGVGDNTNPFESDGFAPIDERPGRAPWDAQRSAANTMDLRGKILRIRPEADGGYSIPPGNLFPPGTADARPEIYIMGCRNPFRFAFDSASGDLLWADIGPDAGKPDPERGPHGMGEFNRASEAGNWGWPYSRGNNQMYRDYDFDSETSGPTFNPAAPVNDSPNNTGLRRLPPTQPSMVWYSYSPSSAFPWLGSGGVNPMSGPVYHRADFAEGSASFPPYFEGAQFLYEWMRDWIVVAHFDASGERIVRADPFMPAHEFSHPMDMLFASDGNLYLLEYGQKWFQQNKDARLNRIRFDPTGSAKVTRAARPARPAGEQTARGLALIEGSDCRACHGIEEQVNGPSYRQIALRYGPDDADYLADRIIAGGSGVWGERHMAAHPQVPREDVLEMVRWILQLNPENRAEEQRGHRRQ